WRGRAEGSKGSNSTNSLVHWLAWEAPRETQVKLKPNLAHWMARHARPISG
ncbi:hypothetical protein HAX54_005015, partial [Datura stramonium]|nr:hypothetical protein [Datura stramonium]